MPSNPSARPVLESSKARLVPIIQEKLSSSLARQHKISNYCMLHMLVDTTLFQSFSCPPERGFEVPVHDAEPNVSLQHKQPCAALDDGIAHKNSSTYTRARAARAFTKFGNVISFDLSFQDSCIAFSTAARASSHPQSPMAISLGFLDPSKTNFATVAAVLRFWVHSCRTLCTQSLPF